jgi:hypothetical protein
MSEQTLTRRHINWKARRVAFLKPGIDRLEAGDDSCYFLEDGLSNVIGYCASKGIETLYMLDTRDVSDAWLTEPADHCLRLQPYINESDAERGRHIHVGYKWAEVLGESYILTLRNASAWFPGLESTTDHRIAWERLRRDLKAHFDPGAEIVSTPGRTGNDLLERSLPRNGVRYGRIPDEALDMIYSNCGQGRLEVFPHDGMLDELVCLDGRWMYAACCTHLPSGPMEDDMQNELPGYTVGFVQADVRVPDGWAHIGLLPKLEGDDEHTLAARILTAEHQLYPLALRLVATGAARLEGSRAVLQGPVDQAGCLLSPAP